MHCQRVVFFKHCICCCWRYSLLSSLLFTCSVIALADVVRAILSAVCDFYSLFNVPSCLNKSYLCYNILSQLQFTEYLSADLFIVVLLFVLCHIVTGSLTD